jgi:hypothetical protein
MDKRKIRVIVAETYASTNNDVNTTCEGIRATGEGQVYGLFHLLPWLDRAYGIEKLELIFASKFTSESEISKEDYEEARTKFRLIIIGGPINNNWAHAAMKFESPQFTYRCMLPKEWSAERDPHVLIDKALGHSINRQEPGSDYGLIVQANSSDGNGFDVLLLSGNTTKGTAAAAQAVSSPSTLKQIISKIEHDSPKPHFATGGCFYIKARGRNVGDLALDITNSKYGSLHQ